MAAKEEKIFLYSIIQDFPYEHWFREKHYNEKVLNEAEKKEYVELADRTISQYLEGLPLLKEELEEIRDRHDDYGEINRVVDSLLLFTIIISIDCMTISKYFILADKDYDKRFMRGKLKVLLNEGFKKLYGFEEKTRQKSEWNRIPPIMDHFPPNIKQQYERLSSLLKQHSESSSWWKDERDIETHLDAEKLYDSRCEELIESEVMMDSMKLFDTLFAVYLFLKNMHGCIYNFLVGKYYRGELK